MGIIAIKGLGKAFLEGSKELLKKSKKFPGAKSEKQLDEKVKTMACKKDIKKSCTGKLIKCITHNLWDELDIHINNFFERVKLQDLVKRNTNI